MSLHVQDLLQWPEATGLTRIERVLVLDRPSNQVLTIDIDNPHALPRVKALSDVERAIETAEAIFVTKDPYGFLRQPDEVLDARYESETWAKYRRHRDARWAIIEPILAALSDTFFGSKELGPLVQQAHERTKCNKRHIYRYLRWYWQRGASRNALLPRYDRCGFTKDAHLAKNAHHVSLPDDPDPPKWGHPRTATLILGAHPGININDKIREKFRRGTSLYYETRQRAPLVHAYNKIISHLFVAGYTMKDGDVVPTLLPPEVRPTIRQYRYWYEKEWDPVRTGISREGIRTFNLKRRAVLGGYRSSLGLLGPGSRYQIDATIGDVYLVCELERQAFGRPVIYVVTDVFSHLIVGISVGLEGPSWAGAMLALENMARNKVEYGAEYGVIIRPEEWPSEHIPRQLCGDRAELLSKASDTLVTSLDITVSNAAAYRADWKGLVERDFRVLNDECISWLPGHTNGFKKRGERDCRLDAQMSLRDFTQYLIYTVVEYNTVREVLDEILTPAMIRDGVQPYPCELWKWGIANQTGALRKETRAVVQRSLLPHVEATVTGEGITFRGLHYSCERAEQQHWYERARVLNSWSVPILFDPRTPKRIFLDLVESDEPEVCGLLPRDVRFASGSWADVEHHQVLHLVQSQERVETKRQTRAYFEAHREAVLQQAQSITQEAKHTRGPESNAAQITGMRERRKTERQREVERQEWTLGVDNQSGNGNVTVPGSMTPEDEAAAEKIYERQILASLSQTRDSAITEPTYGPGADQITDLPDVSLSPTGQKEA